MGNYNIIEFEIKKASNSKQRQTYDNCKVSRQQFIIPHRIGSGLHSSATGNYTQHQSRLSFGDDHHQQQPSYYAPLRATKAQTDAKNLQATSRFPDFYAGGGTNDRDEESSSMSDDDMAEMEVMIMSFKNEVSELKVLPQTVLTLLIDEIREKLSHETNCVKWQL